MSNWTAGLISVGLEALRGTPTNRNRVGAVVRGIAGYPIKLIAAFFCAPFLILRLATKVDNPVRRWIARFGIVVSLLAVYAAGTFVGRLTIAIMLGLQVGAIWGIGFFVGTYVTTLITVALSVFVFNTVALVFVHMSQEEVLSYLERLST